MANPLAVRVEAKCLFRITGRQPELWNPQTAGMVPLAVYEETAEGISIPLHFEPSGSMFIVFPPEAKPFDSVVSFTRDGRPVFAAAKPVTMAIQKATYGVPGDPKRTRDVRAKLQAMLAEGLTTFQVRELAWGMIRPRVFARPWPSNTPWMDRGQALPGKTRRLSGWPCPAPPLNG